MQNRTNFAKQLRKNQNDAEKLLWAKLRNRRFSGVKFRRQQPIGKYIVDFVSYEVNLIIELDGGQHSTRVGKSKDTKRKQELESLGYRVLRFWNNELLKNIDDALDIIHRELTVPHPALSQRARVIR